MVHCKNCFIHLQLLFLLRSQLQKKPFFFWKKKTKQKLNKLPNRRKELTAYLKSSYGYEFLAFHNKVAECKHEQTKKKRFLFEPSLSTPTTPFQLLSLLAVKAMNSKDPRVVNSINKICDQFVRDGARTLLRTALCHTSLKRRARTSIGAAQCRSSAN